MLKKIEDRLEWEVPRLQCLDMKRHTNSGLVILPIEILTVQGPS
jgi:hypothetical protein